MTAFPTVESIVGNFRSYLDRATAENLRDAESWYSQATDFACGLCAIRSDWSLVQAASVISALSPRERWNSNLAKAMAFACGQPIRGLGANIRRAERASRDGFAALTGPKTLAFAQAIAGDRDAVVIDTWMLKASGCGRKSVTGKQYGILASAIRILALERGMDARTVQAAIWIVARGAAQ
jgi:hypothetical protein